MTRSAAQVYGASPEWEAHFAMLHEWVLTHAPAAGGGAPWPDVLAADSRLSSRLEAWLALQQHLHTCGVLDAAAAARLEVRTLPATVCVATAPTHVLRAWCRGGGAARGAHSACDCLHCLPPTLVLQQHLRAHGKMWHIIWHIWHIWHI